MESIVVLIVLVGGLALLASGRGVFAVKRPSDAHGVKKRKMKSHSGEHNTHSH